MSLRCLLGYHAYERTDTVAVDHGTWRSETNAACRRCRRRAWFNWPIVGRAGGGGP